MDLANIKVLTKEQTDSLYAVRNATDLELLELASLCKQEATIKYNSAGQSEIVLSNGDIWSPQYDLTQSHLLLAHVIADGDCRLFYDDGVHEYFVYQFKAGAEGDGPPLAHQLTLADTVFAAALELWFSEEE